MKRKSLSSSSTSAVEEPNPAEIAAPKDDNDKKTTLVSDIDENAAPKDDIAKKATLVSDIDENAAPKDDIAKKATLVSDIDENAAPRDDIAKKATLVSDIDENAAPKDDIAKKATLVSDIDENAAPKADIAEKATLVSLKEPNPAKRNKIDWKELLVFEKTDDKDNALPEELTNYQAIAAKHEEDASIAMSFPVNPHLCPDLNDLEEWTAAQYEMYAKWFRYERGYRWMKRSEEEIYNRCLKNNPPGANRYF